MDMRREAGFQREEGFCMIRFGNLIHQVPGHGVYFLFSSSDGLTLLGYGSPGGLT